jgi:hypothetical protein
LDFAGCDRPVGLASQLQSKTSQRAAKMSFGMRRTFMAFSL